MIAKDYKDKKGIMRRVLVPDDSTPPEMGIPISIDLDEELLNRGNSPDFIKRLYAEMTARGVVSPSDCLRADSPMLLRSALLAAILVDAQVIQMIAQEQVAHGEPSHQSKRRTTR